jgi:NTE family protein
MAKISGKTAFVMAGGGSLGAIQVGMLRAILAAGVVPDFIVGSSVGAINASYFAAFPNERGVERLTDVWLGLRRADIFPFTLATAIGLFRHPNNLVDPAGLRRLIEANLPYARLEDAALPVHVVATDPQGLDVCISRGPAVEAILASAAIPAVFPPVRINGRALMDGAIAANTPIGVAAGLGASRIIVLPTGFACALKEPPEGAIAKALHAITLLISAQLMHELERLPLEIIAHVAPVLCPLTVSPFDFSASAELIERAARSTCDWILEGGLTRRSRPKDLAPHPH